MLQRLYDEGQIYKDKQAGYYSVRQEQFLTDKERGPDGEFGPEWGQVEQREEENYYFRLAKHKDWLLAYLRSHPDCVTPDFRQTELHQRGRETKRRPLHLAPEIAPRVGGSSCPSIPITSTYVWFDALMNYISFIGYDPAISSFSLQPSSFQEKWPAVHVIGKDILIPAHGIYWLIMLHALGFPDEQMPKFLVHGWWNITGAKMSKSLGNVVDPNELADKYGPEALRYYLMSDIVTGKDADFSEERLIERYNSDLANSLGNLLNRTLSMAVRYCGGALRRGQPPVLDLALERAGRAIQLATEANQQIEQTAPWKLMKEGQAETVAALLYDLAERLRIIAILISPVLPKAAHGIFDQLNWKMEPALAGKEERFSLAEAEWGKLPDGHVVGKPIPLFPRIEVSPPSAA